MAKTEHGSTPLHIAALNGHDTVAELLIANGADANAKAGKEGYTPLHMTAFHGQTSAAKLLIAAGADVYAKGPNDITPLDIAVGNDHQPLAELLRG